MADPKVYTSEELAKAVSLAPELSSLAGDTPLGDDAVLELLVQRLGAVPGIDHYAAATNQIDVARPEDLAILIAGAIPKSMRSMGVIGSVDLRPYLQALNGKVITDQRWVGQPTKQVTYKATTTPFVEGESKRLSDQVGAEVPFTKVAGANPAAASDPTTNVGAITDPVTGQAVDPATGLPFTSLDQSAGVPQFPVESFRHMVAADAMTLESAIGQEADLNAKVGGFFPVDVGLHTTDPSATGKATGMVHNQKISLSDAVNYLGTLKQSEVANMQAKLAAAGYFDKTGKPGVAYDEGNPYDPATMDAWKQLIIESVKSNRDASVILGQNLKTYREETRMKRLGVLSKLDPSYTRAIANDYGQSILGRNLNASELDSLQNHLETLQYQRAGYVAGANDNQLREPLADTATGTTQDDAQLYILDHTKSEQRRVAAQRRAYRLNAAL